MKPLKKQKPLIFKWLKLRAYPLKKKTTEKKTESVKKKGGGSKASPNKPRPKVFYSLPKKTVPLSVTRNRLKRQAREEFKKGGLNSHLQLSLFPSKEKNFYKFLKNKDFRLVFRKALKKLKKQEGRRKKEEEKRGEMKGKT